MKLNDLLHQIKSPCGKCPYKLGLVQTLINPCPQCKANGYQTFELFRMIASVEETNESQISPEVFMPDYSELK